MAIVRIQKTVNKLALLGLIGYLLVPFMAHASQITNRRVVIGSSAPSAITSYSFNFKPGTSGNIGAIKLEICDSPVESVSCTNSAGSSGFSFTSNSASVQSQSGISGFTVGTGTPAAPTANTFWITNGTPQNISSSTTITVNLQNVRNPSVANTEYYAKITTYSDSAGTNPNEVDFGGVALATANAITVTGNMPESLVFCVGITISTDCSTIGGGTTVDFGTFSPLSTSMGTSVMQASTNASSGYIITINGTTMTSGSNTIPAMGTQSANSTGCSPSCTRATGSSQFGTNVVDNASPNIGANVTGAGTATGSGGYNVADSFRFFSGDTVASVNGPSDTNTFTNSYIVNVGGNQAAGQYTATMTYICTATF